jgi:ComF family protein
LCGVALRHTRRYPVCPACLESLEPLAPEYFCTCCRTPFLNAFPLDEQGRCGLCRSGRNRFDAAYAFGAYDGPLQRLIQLYKYAAIATLARPFGALMAAALPRQEPLDALIPVPMHWLRRWRRGFNQSELLARELSRRTGLPVKLALGRTRWIKPQAGLRHPERRNNVRGAFGARRGVPVEGLRLLLVDDVMTTGATASACAEALKKAGAARVSVLTLARADRRTAPPAVTPAAISQPRGAAL